MVILTRFHIGNVKLGIKVSRSDKLQEDEESKTNGSRTEKGPEVQQITYQTMTIVYISDFYG